MKSIYGATWRDDFEVIVVDNNSHDGSVEMIHSEFPDVKLIANKDNKLFAIANNQGAKICKGDYLLLLNSDTIISGDNLQRMIDFYDEQNDNVICIGPKILNKDGSLQSHGHHDVGDKFQSFINFYHVNKILPLHWFSKKLDCNPNHTRPTGWVTGACMMIRRELYEKVGGLNEKLIFYGEEPEFGYRTKKLGYKTLYFADAFITHLGGASTDKSKKSFEKGMAEYDSLVRLTIGRRKAISVAKLTRNSLRFKRLFHPNKKYFDECIEQESRVIDWFMKKLKEE